MDHGTRNWLTALLAGDWAAKPMRDRAAAACGSRSRFAAGFVTRLLAAHPETPTFDQLAAFAAADFGRRRQAVRLPVARIFWLPPAMTPRVEWDVPPLRTTTELADWLGLDPHHLDWFADARRLSPFAPRKVRSLPRPGASGEGEASAPFAERKATMAGEKLRHYRARWLPKSGGRWRLIEAPKPRLKAIQRRILDEILSHIPPHDAAHGFCPGRSIVTNAAPHAGRAVVMRFDLKEFFPSVSRARVRAIFATAGYPEPVAAALANLCTTRLPIAVWDARPGDRPDDFARQRLLDFHLPQGAPTSPALANLAAFHLDARLSAYADQLGATYTRYADDLTVSGGDELRRAAGSVRRAVAQIAEEEGFALNLPKTRILGRGVRQAVAGVVVNVRPNVPRADFDALKAILTNCGRLGPAAQNRDAHPDFRAHLAGRVAHVAMVNPVRGRRLWAAFDRIVWPDPAPTHTMPGQPSGVRHQDSGPEQAPAVS